LLKSIFLDLKETDIAWLAGLFEGEASFGLDTRSATRYKNSTAPPSPYIKIAMTDEDIIAKVSKLVNKSYFSPRRLTVTKKQVYICHIGDRSTLNFLLPRLLPYMGARRQKTILNCLKELNNWKIWYLKGGRKKMAQQGPLAKKIKKKFSTEKTKN
jgi:hypothetical protein